MSYDDAVNWLESLNVFGIKPGLERIKILADKLGSPQNKYKTVHVTGTNGKGSVCAMLAEILQTDGYNVGFFSSPHLESYCERFKINGENISEKDFAKIIENVKSQNVEATQFEILTAAAFEYFAEKKVDIAVIEVGLGGLLDSTNIITPEVSIITNVALDHTNILGDLKNIAWNKAGIIKPNISVVTGATEEPLEIIREVAEKNNSPLYEVNEPTNLFVNLKGEYQKFNAAIAVKTSELLNIPQSVIIQGLRRVQWAGRFEVHKNLIIDGAHNPNGAAALRQSLDKNFAEGSRAWIFGALRDKNIDEMIKILFRPNDFVIVTTPESERAATCEEICKKLSAKKIKCVGIEKISDAIEKLMKFNADVKIISGSLYLIGTARKILKLTYAEKFSSS